MKKLIAIAIVLTQIGLFAPASVLALESTGQPTSDVGSGQNTTQNSATINSNQVNNVQTSDNRLLEQQGSSSNFLNSKADPSKSLTVGVVQSGTLEVVNKPQPHLVSVIPQKRKISLKTILVRGLIIAALLVLANFLWNRYRASRPKKEEPKVAEPIVYSKSTKKTPAKPKKKKKNVGRKKR